ncbi:PucR family transcriptional regulator [Actinoallomurus sp. CA-150999]|uniref:PucR family transcriptional regulator n=1 Tax=Actinoallomurus sp. CA-150999 TaxID=3239887 RepID=UPI003D8E59F6
MEVAWPPIRDEPAYMVWRDVLQPIAVEMRLSAAGIAEQSISRGRDEIPRMFPEAQIIDEATSSTEESLRQLAQIVEFGEDPREAEPPLSTIAIVRATVWRQVPLADHMRFYRVAQEVLWEWLLARLTTTSRDAAQLATAMELISGWLFAYVDHALVRVEQVYESEREAWLHGAAAARATAVEDVLADRERNPQAAARRLRYDLNRHHIAIIAWVDHVPDGREPLVLLSESIADIARFLKAESSITHPLGALAIVGWLSGRGSFATDATKALDNASRGLHLAQGVSLAAGEPGYQLKGFRRTYIEAGHARRVASLVDHHGATLTRYRDVALAALCTADSDHALTFAKRVLGPLANTDEVTARLASTLAAYLRANRSRTRAATLLGVHPNTVSYRVNQAEELLGRSVSTDNLELQVALALLPTLQKLEHTRALES